MENKIFYLPKFQNSGTLPESNKILQNVGETILDFTPIVGDIKGLTYDPYKAYKEDGWKGGLTMMGLGLLGLIPFVGDVVKKGLGTTRKVYKGLSEVSDKSIRRNRKTLKDSPFSLKNLLSKPIDTWKIGDEDWDVLEYKKLGDYKVRDFDITDYIQTQLIDRAKQEGKWSDVTSNLFTNNGNIRDIKIAIGRPKSNGSSGWYIPDKRQIILNIDNPKQAHVLIHEFRHLLDDYPKGAGQNLSPIKLTALERDELTDAYRIRTLTKDLLNSNLPKKADTIKERVAENATYRFFAWVDYRKKFNKNPTVEELNKYIRDADDEKILSFVKRSGYANSYNDYLDNMDVENAVQKKIDDDNDWYYEVTYGAKSPEREYSTRSKQADKIRKAMMSIMGLSGVGIVSKNMGNNNENDTNRNQR